MDGPNFTEKATILVVDDTPDNLALMNSLLKDDYKVRIANGGEKALKIAVSDSPPDLILLDITMPGMDGYEVCQRLKRDPRTMNIPVIFLTAKAEMEDEKKGLELGAVDYITKPMSPPIVMARVKNHLALKAMADVLQKKNLELEKARAAAEKANLAKSDFLSSMSHELRSPLNAILGFAQLLETAAPLLTPAQVANIDQILQAGWHLLRLINEILDLSAIESGKVSLSSEAVSLAELLSECEDMMETQAQERGLHMTFPRFDHPVFVWVDRTRLKQIIINLLSNAIKYNRERGSVIVECSASAPGRIRISVKDTGAGLPPELLAQLFQPFNRLGQAVGDVAGTGIGLMVTKRLAELMDGVLGVESTVGKGSVFWCELAAAAAPHLAIQNNEAEVFVPPPVPNGTTRRTVLYVEDNPANMMLVEQIIARRLDLRLLSAVNGAIGLELARNCLPAVILMDINLPGISGLDAMQLLRKDPATAHIPVVALSANALPRDIEKGLKAGFFRYITKPIRVREFMDTLNVALEFAEKKAMERNQPPR